MEFVIRMPRLAIASDHAGYSAKEAIKDHLRRLKYEVEDFGTAGDDPVDYPDFIYPAARSVAEGRNQYGIVLGGSGNGESMVANKVTGVRCAVCWNELSAQWAKEHNNANMIAIGARLVSTGVAIEIVDTWLGALFLGGRHVCRIEKMENLANNSTNACNGGSA